TVERDQRRADVDARTLRGIQSFCRGRKRAPHLPAVDDVALVAEPPREGGLRTFTAPSAQQLAGDRLVVVFVLGHRRTFCTYRCDRHHEMCKPYLDAGSALVHNADWSRGELSPMKRTLCISSLIVLALAGCAK